MRHRAEISPNCRISLETISNHPYSFSVLPSPTDRLYILDGLTQEDRVRFQRISVNARTCGFSASRCANSSSSGLTAVPRFAALAVSTTIFLSVPFWERVGTESFDSVNAMYALALAAFQANLKKYAIKVINKKKVDRTILKHELMVLRAIKVDNRTLLSTVATRLQRKPRYHSRDLRRRLPHQHRYGVSRRRRSLQADLPDRRALGYRLTLFFHAEWESARIVRHIARGLEALHEKQILHLDVKLENVIFESKEPNSLMKLADFGCCYVQDVEERPPDEIIGTAGYIAPEIISVGTNRSTDVQNLQYSAACDVYSLGVLLYILLIGYPPYQGNDTREILLFTLYQSIDVFKQ